VRAKGQKYRLVGSKSADQAIENNNAGADKEVA
jgi:hypothetical protein